MLIHSTILLHNAYCYCDSNHRCLFAINLLAVPALVLILKYCSYHLLVIIIIIFNNKNVSYLSIFVFILLYFFLLHCNEEGNILFAWSNIFFNVNTYLLFYLFGSYTVVKSYLQIKMFSLYNMIKQPNNIYSYFN